MELLHFAHRHSPARLQEGIESECYVEYVQWNLCRSLGVRVRATKYYVDENGSKGKDHNDQLKVFHFLLKYDIGNHNCHDR